MNARATGISAVFAAVAGAALWPPQAVYWTAVAERIGEAPTLAVVIAVAVGLGGAFATIADIRPQEFAIGAATAYGLGMAAIAVVIAPDSPVHLGLYGGILLCLVAGAVGAGRRATDD
ncbi:hypothetical protein ACFQMA_13090 [Halosimplex aquaticum]|uniref:SPW repeat-containing protein n=1 Tax=Halosimplex aquaticum TaxID=3026162 RepID=A0ABD5Y0I7_9EURY|nr:hypothetical protein [Halosimplex aquaticum]